MLKALQPTYYFSHDPATILGPEASSRIYQHGLRGPDAEWGRSHILLLALPTKTELPKTYKNSS